MWKPSPKLTAPRFWQVGRDRENGTSPLAVVGAVEVIHIIPPCGAMILQFQSHFPGVVPDQYAVAYNDIQQPVFWPCGANRELAKSLYEMKTGNQVGIKQKEEK